MYLRLYHVYTRNMHMSRYVCLAILREEKHSEHVDTGLFLEKHSHYGDVWEQSKERGL